MLPRVGGVDPYAGGGGSQQRPGTGAFARKRKPPAEAARSEDEPADLPPPDPLLSEIDRLRALDPVLTESGAHRALLALRAYQQKPPPGSDAGVEAAAAPTTRTILRRAQAYQAPPAPAPGPGDAAAAPPEPTPPAPPTGGDGPGP